MSHDHLTCLFPHFKKLDCTLSTDFQCTNMQHVIDTENKLNNILYT